MKLSDFIEEDLCDICGYGLPKRVVDGLFVCGKCFRNRKPNLDRPATDPDDDLPVRRNKHERPKTRS